MHWRLYTGFVIDGHSKHGKVDSNVHQRAAYHRADLQCVQTRNQCELDELLYRIGRRSRTEMIVGLDRSITNLRHLHTIMNMTRVNFGLDHVGVFL